MSRGEKVRAFRGTFFEAFLRALRRRHEHVRVLIEHGVHRGCKDALITLIPVRDARETSELASDVGGSRVRTSKAPVSVLVLLVGEAAVREPSRPWSLSRSTLFPFLVTSR